MTNEWIPINSTGSYWRFGESGARLSSLHLRDGWCAHVPGVGSVYRETLKDAILWVEEQLRACR